MSGLTLWRSVTKVVYTTIGIISQYFLVQWTHSYQSSNLVEIKKY
jgi:hypothetical protein